MCARECAFFQHLRGCHFKDKNAERNKGETYQSNLIPCLKMKMRIRKTIAQRQISCSFEGIFSCGVMWFYCVLCRHHCCTQFFFLSLLSSVQWNSVVKGMLVSFYVIHISYFLILVALFSIWNKLQAQQNVEITKKLLDESLFFVCMRHLRKITSGVCGLCIVSTM